MKIFPRPISDGLSLWITQELDPDNGEGWLKRWSNRGVDVTAPLSWSGRILAAVDLAATGQRRVPWQDAGQMILTWCLRHPYKLHTWGCPDKDCGPDDKPKPVAFLFDVFKKRLSDATRAPVRKGGLGDPKVTVDGKRHRLYPETMEVPLSVLSRRDENDEQLDTFADLVQKYSSNHNDARKTVVTERLKYHADLDAGKL